MGLSPEAMASAHEFKPEVALATPTLGEPYYPLILNGMSPDELAGHIADAYADRPDAEVALDGAEVRLSYITTSYSPGLEVSGSPMPPIYVRQQRVTALFGAYGLMEVIAEDVSAPDAPGLRIPSHGVTFSPFRSESNQTLFDDEKGRTYLLPGRETTFTVGADGSRATTTINEMNYTEADGRFEPSTPAPQTTFHEATDVSKSRLLYPLFPAEKSSYQVVTDSVQAVRSMQDRGVEGAHVGDTDGRTAVVGQYIRNGGNFVAKYVVDEHGHAIFYQYWGAALTADPATRDEYADKERPSESLFEQEEQEGGLQVSRRLKVLHEPGVTGSDMVRVIVDERYTNHQFPLPDGSMYDLPDVTRTVSEGDVKIADQSFQVERDLFRPVECSLSSTANLQFQTTEDVTSLREKNVPATKTEGARFVRIFYRGRESEQDLAIHLRVVREDPNDPQSPLVCELDGDQPFEMTSREKLLRWI